MMSRFMSKVQVPTDPNGCWIWQGPKMRTKLPYGRFVNKLAHRLSFEIFHGRVPKLFVLHSCDNPECVNPAHLREGTHSDNVQDAVNRRRHVQRSKTHCPQGHEYSLENTGWQSCNGGKSISNRYCKICKRSQGIAARLRRKNGGSTDGNDWIQSEAPTSSIT